MARSLLFALLFLLPALAEAAGGNQPEPDAVPAIPAAWNRFLYRDRDHRVLVARARDRLRDEATDEAISLLQRVLDSPADSFLWTGTPPRLSSARREARRLLAGMRPAGRAAYRRRVAPLAARLLPGDQFDGLAVRGIVTRYSLTGPGLEALNLLGSWHLDRGRPAFAARAFERLLAGPRQRGRPPASLVAKTALALANSGQRPAARRLLARHRRVNLVLPDVQPPANTPADWRLPIDSPDHNPNRLAAGAPLLEPDWTVPLATSSDPSPRRAWVRGKRDDPRETAAVTTIPLVVGEQVIWRTDHGLRAAWSATGHPAWSFESRLPLSTRIGLVTQVAGSRRGRPDGLTLAVLGNPAMGLLTADASRLYAVDVVPLPKVTSPDPPRFTNRRTPVLLSPWTSDLVALPLAGPTGQDSNGVARRRRPSWTFPARAVGTRPSPDDPLVLGPPLPLGDELLVLVEVRRQVELVCLEAASGSVRWRQPLALCETSIREFGGTHRLARACLPACRGGIAVCPTGLGVLVAVDLLDGTLLWARDCGEPVADATAAVRFIPLAGPGRRNRGDPGLPNLPLIVADRVVHLAASSPDVLCLELATGDVAWRRPRGDADYVATADSDTVLLLGGGLARAVKLSDGTTTWTTRLGHVSGRGVRVGAHYLVPLKAGRIARLELATGRETAFTLPRTDVAGDSSNPVHPIGVPPQGDQSLGNLVVAGDRIVSLDGSRLAAFPQARPRLGRVLGELEGDPGSSELRLLACELRLALGQFDRAHTDLRQFIEAAVAPGRRNRAVALYRELLYRQLDRPAADVAELVESLERLATTPRQRARLIVRSAEWHLEQGRHQESWAAVDRLGRLGLRVPIAAGRDGLRLIASGDWAADLFARIRRAADRVDDPRVALRLATEHRDVLASGDLEGLERFVARHRGSHAASTARLDLALRLTEHGRFQQAELHLLAARRGPDLATRAAASVGLVRLWSRLGMYDEASGVLDKLADGPLADVRLPDGRSGREFVAGLPPDNLAVGSRRRRLERPTPVVTATVRVAGGFETDLDSTARYRSYRRRFSVPDNGSLDLLETIDGRERLLSVIDRQTGVQMLTVPLSGQFYNLAPRSNHLRCGHLLPMGGVGTISGISLLDRGDRVPPNWTRSVPSPGGRAAMFRVGPAGAEHCCFQDRQRLFVVDPLSGRVRWSRSDLDPSGGLHADATYGIFGDDEVLVVCAADRVTWSVYRTATGERLTTRRLPIDLRTRRRPFGRRLMYVTSRGDGTRELRVWDPLLDKTTYRADLATNVSPNSTPDEQLVFLDSQDRVHVVDVAAGRSLLVVDPDPEHDVNTRAIQAFRLGEYWYVNRQSAGVLAGRPQPRYIYFAGNSLLPLTHVNGQLTVVKAATARVAWRRLLHLRTVIRPPHIQLPVLVMIARIRDRKLSSSPMMLLELVDIHTGRMLYANERLPSDRIVQAWWDPASSRLELRGLKTRIDVTFTAANNR